ncbi:hypothetical protein TAMA11512_10750 [Selenomonas sp. TAMA-11512]|uniref:flagellin lysine-N-methylase n=1 Tax=Selenomonas sp. TAMA-11512 TaxID=3095337 RepID=UPI00308DEF28|nr:hypothetical protein TAMA11512_10750 [Selenomonas sp. TAMA-11512]
MEKKVEVCQPSYVEHFVCDGARCQARCCRGWQIAVNDAAYALYEEIDGDLRQDVLASIRSFPPNAAFPKGGREIILREDGSCPMICTKDQLCRIQRTYGETYLSIACQVFPRMAHSLERIQFRTMSLACPVAADAAMTVEGMKWSRTAYLDEEERIWQALFQAEGWGTPYRRQESDSDRRRMTVVLSMAAVSTSEALSLVERLCLLAYLADDIDEQELNDADDDAIDTCVLPYFDMGETQAKIRSVLSDLPFDPVGYAALWRNVFLRLQETEDALEIIRPILDRVNQVYRPDLDAKDVDLEQLAVRILEVRAVYEEEMNRRYGELMKCYQLHEFQHLGFPYQFDGTKLENVFLHILLIAFFEVCFYGLTAYCGHVPERHEVIEFIALISRAVDHSIPFRKAMEEIVKHEGKRPEVFLRKLLVH